MHPIATLTFNPALDMSTTTERVEPIHKLRCGPSRFDPGGGGINVARVVKILGGEATAVYAAGGPVGAMLRGCLDTLGLDQRVVAIKGQTRENVTVDETATGDQYRFVLPGPELSPDELGRCFDAVAALEPAPAYLVVSGGYPPGADPEGISSEVARLAKTIGARLVLDTAQAMRHAPPGGVFLMKPNLRELSQMSGRLLEERQDQIEAARSVVRSGGTEVLVVSLGAGGALLVTEALAEHVAAPDVPTLSAVGAGDSMVGAISFALASNWSLSKAVRYGVAAGAATLMTPGTGLCRREDVERLYKAMARGDVTG